MIKKKSEKLAVRSENPADLDELISQGARHAELGNLDGMIDICRQILVKYPKRHEYRQILVHTLFAKEQFELALEELSCLKKENFQLEWTNTFAGLCNAKLGRHENALMFFNESLQVKETFEGFLNRGNVLKELGRLQDAAQDYQSALKVNQVMPEVWNNLGVVLMEQSKFADAISNFDRALKLSPKYLDASLNKGNALIGLKIYNAAFKIFKQLSITSKHVPRVWLNFSFYFRELSDLNAALDCLDRALALDPNYSKGWFNKGAILERSGHSTEAEKCYARAVELDPDYAFIDGEVLHSRMVNCNWYNFDKNLCNIRRKISEDKEVSNPFPMLACIEDPAMQLLVAKKWVARKYSSIRSITSRARKTPKGRLKVGYFSADFHNHATAFLINELILSHDKSKFEIYAFSYGPSLNDEMQIRLKGAFEHFIDVRFLGDDQVADLCANLGLNVAIDLKGFTQDARPTMFSRNLADLHINFLGYPGTLGSLNYDYIVADEIVIPKNMQHCYLEKIIYMPVSYQCNDSQRLFPGVLHCREEYGLKDKDFVICCFNNSYKITPAIFDTWLSILETRQRAVLWLLSDNEEVKRNLLMRAKSVGVDVLRIVFTGRMSLAGHLARYRLADLFVDTFPYGAHTTASEALWMGLPLVTLRGNTFASAVAASLLKALGLESLITDNHTQYQARIYTLIDNPNELTSIKEKLSSNRHSSALFSGVRFARDFESALSTAHTWFTDGLDSQSFYVRPPG